MSRQLAGDSNTCDWGRKQGAPHNTSDTAAEQTRGGDTGSLCWQHISRTLSSSGAWAAHLKAGSTAWEAAAHISAPPPFSESGQLEMASIPRKTTVQATLGQAWPLVLLLLQSKESKWPV